MPRNTRNPIKSALPQTARIRWKTGGAAALLAVLTFLVFAQTVTFDFVNYDDSSFLIRNPHVATGLSWENARWALTSREASNFFPLTWLAHMTLFSLFGDHAGAHHAVNALIHAANAILLFLLFQRLTRQTAPSLFVAALFAVHPLHVESVAWVSSLKDVLSANLGLLALWGYVAYAHAPRWTRYVLVLVLMTLAILAKSTLIVCPALMLCLDYWPLNRLLADSTPATWRNLRRLILEKLPFAAIAVTLALIGVAALDVPNRIDAPLPLWLRVANALVAYIRYLGLTLCPRNLTVFHPNPGAALPLWQPLAAGFVLLAITGGVIWAWRRAPYLLAGWTWFIAALIPVIGLIPLHEQIIVDRYMYLPLIGLAIMVAWGGGALYRRYRIPRVAAVTAACVAVFVMTVLAFRQTQYWQDSETLFDRVMALDHDNPEARLALANARAESGKLEAAIGFYAQVVQSKTPVTQTIMRDALNNWGLALMMLSERSSGSDADAYLREACRKFNAAVDIDPDYGAAHFSWGRALGLRAELTSGEEADNLLAEACAQYAEAVRLQPDDPQGYANWGSALSARAKGKQGQEAADVWTEAYRRFAKAIELRPSMAEAYYNWGNGLAAQAKSLTGGEADSLREEASVKYETAIAAKPDFVQAWYAWGLVWLSRAKAASDPSQAQSYFERTETCFLGAEKLQPGSTAYYLAGVRALQGDAEGCQRWLNISQQRNTLPARAYIEKDESLNLVRGETWFRNLVNAAPDQIR